MLIRELENKTQLDRATIRFYEKEGLITPERKENGYRTYSETDVDTLLKVKLLRQLGMSLEKIKALQQGSEDFSQAMTEQIASLESLIDHAENARQVCIQIRQDAASYDTLDASYYLKLLEQPALVDRRWKPQYVPEFHRRPIAYPWKRYFARRIDFLIFTIVTEFLIVVLFRVRPVLNILSFLNNFWIRYLLWIPAEALLIHYFRTTPGKWLFGIQIESINGGPLDISNGMRRAWDTLRYGYGFNLPIYSYWRHYRSYKDYKDSGYVQWDYEHGAEYQFEYYFSTKRKTAMVLLVVVVVGMFGISLNDIIRPIHRGEDLTIAQFAENYNWLLSDNNASDHFYLRENGSWRTLTQENNVVVVYFSGKPVIVNENGSKSEGYNNLEYKLEDGVIRSISYMQTWENVTGISPMGVIADNVVSSVVCAQDWFNLISYYDFREIVTRQFNGAEGSFTYENIEITWQTDAENCNFRNGIYYRDDDKAEATVTLCFEIRIHSTK